MSSNALSNEPKVLSPTDDRSVSANSLAAKEAAARFRWTGFIIFFFVLQFILWTIAITLTNSDQSHAIDRGYDQQDETWNERRTKQLASDALQWSANLRVDSTADFRGDRLLHLTLTDREGQPVRDATVTGLTFHQSRAKQPKSLKFQEQLAGEYVAIASIRHEGIWRFELQAQRRESVFLHEERITVSFNCQNATSESGAGL